MTDLKLVSWNVNGIRSRVFNSKIATQIKGITEIYPESDSSMHNLITEHSPDIICLQEIKCEESFADVFKLEGYYSYFNSSTLTEARSANRYSGTALYSKEKPIKIETTLPLYEDQEGRIMIIYYETFILINIYAPNSGTNFQNKLLFQDALFDFMIHCDQPLAICGDFNIGKDTFFDKSKAPLSPGIYPEELQFYDKLIEHNFIDALSDDDDVVFTWWNTRSGKITINGKLTYTSRHKNLGWRLDYVFTNNGLSANSRVLKSIGEEHCPHASDHAPILAIIKLNPK